MAHKNNTQNHKLIKQWQSAMKSLHVNDETKGRHIKVNIVSDKILDRSSVDSHMYRAIMKIIYDLKMYLDGGEAHHLKNHSLDKIKKKLAYAQAIIEDHIQKGENKCPSSTN